MSTPLYKDENLSQLLGINLFIKRDDLYSITGGGNKGRKSDYILKDCKSNGYDAVVTCGGAQSNHVRATAIRCKELGLECTIIIHDEQPKVLSGNYLLLKMLDVNIVHCQMENISKVMDNEMDILKDKGFNPLYIFGGGHCVEGTKAYYDAVIEVKKQLNNTQIDYIIHASGTGTTQAGIHCGAKRLYPECKVIGISVARNKKRGEEVILESVNELIPRLNLPSKYCNNINLDDRYTCGGYEKTCNDLLSTIDLVAKNSGLILDPTYTGKAFWGLVDMIKNKEIEKKSNVIFWHTGGLLNLMSFNK
ncbi:1-aminocyclopropane-1-carboxylate deaminase/D-cysteine desulfhydrase [Photobacterium leiognathi]|uniref:1-aminocyclopropane-1-carboxylate deaminase/D-cysteine desulfhydrase n=1 Tax=Photobacterium leiognathi TaxID=553611 RepID=UPI002982896B|nr:pyridoxal-phosphate dependent enzyme [Photobacterium leiognathi]